MRIVAALALTAAASAAAASAQARPLAPLYDPVTLNIGLNCQWQHRCVERQLHAMKRARAFVAKRKPAPWLIHLCNRNAKRSASRIDWVGFDNCIRNPKLRGKR